MPTQQAPVEAIDTASALPYYHQLKTILRARVEREGLVAGDRLWSDNEVSQEYGVSRSVVRQALAELENEGLLERIRGKGTFLARERRDHGLAQSLQGLYAHAQKAGITLESEVLRQEIVAAGEVVAEALALPIHAPVFVLERVRRAEGEPWARTTTWLPAALFPGIEKRDFCQSSLYRILSDDYGLTMGTARRSIEAVLATEEIAASLEVEEGAPLLRIRSVLCDEQGRPIEAFTAYHRGDTSRFDIIVGKELDSAAVTIEHA
ncbi:MULTISPECIES: GntR family transcriptional regulator [unclassified Actinobaculum]|uniref:GntR family transcriptional regulator n=1 Tax=unclassified Actinobaculum TaxID=2609299 RepID=UPI000D5290E5|nr:MULTISPECIES: GntR family transcriptional regulator [unclassified Actinobaculum]AWE41995.1 GntR family transcriptional regulator [Actinobaculum sp. 313]RTE50089.1 GntR family transcriptional regulator [Actinobaculum sp. 352]